MDTGGPGATLTDFPFVSPQVLDAEWDDLWDQFDERRYLNAKKWRVGDDPYKLYAFNQRESERISSNRAIPDTRHLRYFVLRLSASPHLPAFVTDQQQA